MKRLSVLLLALSLTPGVFAQPNPADILDRMEAERQRRIADVENYTVVEKSHLTPMPSVQYYERATDADGNPVAAFRLVPPNELANRAAAARGEPTSEQLAEGLLDALGAVAGVAGGVAAEAGVEVPAEIQGALFGAGMGLDGIAAGPNADPNADALAGLEHLETLKEHATSARAARYHSRPAYLIVASGFEDVEVNLGLPEGVQVQRMVLWVDAEELVPLKLEIEAQGETENGQTFPIVIEREDLAYQRVSPSAMYEPTCTRGRLVFGGDEQSAVVMRRFVELNQGPPSQEKQRELLAEAMDDFENYGCI